MSYRRKRPLRGFGLVRRGLGIANDWGIPAVVPDSFVSSVSSSVSSIFGASSSGVDWLPLALIAGLVAVGVAL